MTPQPLVVVSTFNIQYRPTDLGSSVREETGVGRSRGGDEEWRGRGGGG